MQEAPPRARSRPVAVPKDPRVRAFLDALAELLAESILRDLPATAEPLGATPDPRATP